MNLLRTLLAGCLLLLAGCSSTREVETSPPRPYEGVEDAVPQDASQARVRIFLERGETDLPEAIDRLQFRTAEVRVHTAGGEWIRLPSDASQIELERGSRGQRRLVLDTRIPPARYDSMGVTLSHVFVRFNENAGAPLTTAADVPQTFAFEVDAGLDTPTTIYIRLEPEASLNRTPDCRWFFVPILRPETASVDARTR